MVALAAVVGPAPAQDARRDIGTLSCMLLANADAARPQLRELLCAFRQDHGGPEETYTGTAQALAADPQPGSVRALIWIVRAQPATTTITGLLQQAYAADPAAAVGRAPMLIGEWNATIALQPFADSPPSATADIGGRPPAAALIVAVSLRLKSTAS